MIMKATRHSGRTNKNGKPYSAYHDLDERLKLSKEYKDNNYQLTEHLQEHHIDVERVNQNMYILPCRTKTGEVKLTPMNYNDILKNNPDFSLRDMELFLYENLYGKELEAKNARYAKSRHYEHIKSMQEVYEHEDFCPYETILQIGACGDDVPREVLIDAVKEYVAEHNKRYPQAPIIDVSIHCDEQKNAVNNLGGDYVAHAHKRQVFFTYDKDGNPTPNQNKALEDMGFDLPEPDKKKGRYNNRLMCYTAESRELWYDIAEQKMREYTHNPDFKIDREPIKYNYKRDVHSQIADMENIGIANHNKKLKQQSVELQTTIECQNKEYSANLGRNAKLGRAIDEKEKRNADLDETFTLLTREISAKTEDNNQLNIENQRLKTLNEKQRADYDEMCKVRAEQLEVIKQGDEVKQGLKAEIMAMQQQEADLTEKLTVISSKLSEISGLYEKDFEQFINSNFFKTQMRDAKYQAFVDVMQEWKSDFLDPCNLRELNISRETFEKIINMMITDVYSYEIAPLIENPVIEAHEHERSL